MKRLVILFVAAAFLFPVVAACKVLPLEGERSPVESRILDAVGDAYVVTDAAAAEDPEGLREKNFGSQDFVRLWYAWKVLKEEQVIAISLLQFDLGPVKDKEIMSAHLQLFGLRADIPQPARLVDVHLVDGVWSEQQVTFTNRPPWAAVPIATSAVYGAGVWYSWDVTASVVRKAKEGAVSYALGLRAMEEKNEEQVLFSSREVGRNAPRLIVTYAAPTAAVPWYFWVGAIFVVAVGAFIIGWRVARRRPAPAKPA